MAPDGRPPLDADEPPDGAAKRPPNWRALAYPAAALALLSLGSVIGSSRSRGGARPDVAPSAVVTVTAVAAPPPASTATRTVTVTAQPTDPLQDQLDPIPLVAYGTGPAHTRTFTTTSTEFEAIYTYDCRLRGSPGRFDAHLDRNGDEVGPIAHTAGRAGRGGAGLANGQSTFSIVVDTPCSWTVMVVDSSAGGFP